MKYEEDCTKYVPSIYIVNTEACLEDLKDQGLDTKGQPGDGMIIPAAMSEVGELAKPGVSEADSDMIMINDLYTCTQCCLIFPQLVSLERHVKKMHREKYITDNKSSPSDPIEYQRTNDSSPQRNRIFVSDSLEQVIEESKVVRDICSFGYTKNYNKPVDVVFDNSVTSQSVSCSNVTEVEFPIDCTSCTEISKSRVDFKICGCLRNLEQKPYNCDVCGVGFTRSSNLHIHMRIHTGEKPYKCDVCGTHFARIDRLREHMITHTGVKPFTCQVCAIGFTRSRNLQEHMRKHTGEKPYICDICEAAFIRNSSLKEHRMIHTGKKPYKCDVCDLQFSRIQHLREHVRIHTGEKPYKCDICGAGFTRGYSLQGHIKTHRGEKAYTCHVYGAEFNQSRKCQEHNLTHAEEIICNGNI